MAQRQLNREITESHHILSISLLHRGSNFLMVIIRRAYFHLKFYLTGTEVDIYFFSLTQHLFLKDFDKADTILVTQLHVLGDNSLLCLTKYTA